VVFVEEGPEFHPLALELPSDVAVWSRKRVGAALFGTRATISSDGEIRCGRDDTDVHKFVSVEDV
jgi:hypothetical protein